MIGYRQHRLHGKVSRRFVGHPVFVLRGSFVRGLVMGARVYVDVSRARLWARAKSLTSLPKCRLAMEELAAELARVTAERKRLQQQAQKQRSRLAHVRSRIALFKFL